MKTKNTNGKDLITTGIYTALYIVALFAASVANVTPLTFMFYPAVTSLLGGTFFLMLAIKVKNSFSIIVWGIIVGLLFLVLGMGMALPFFVVGAVVGQLIIAKSGHKSLGMVTLAYIITSVCSVGGYAQLFFTTDSYLKEASARGLTDDFVNGLSKYATGTFLAVIILVTAAAALCGIMAGRLIMKKHLVKAGVI